MGYRDLVITSGPGDGVRQPGKDTQGASRLRAGMWPVRRQRSVRVPARRRAQRCPSRNDLRGGTDGPRRRALGRGFEFTDEEKAAIWQYVQVSDENLASATELLEDGNRGALIAGVEFDVKAAA